MPKEKKARAIGFNHVALEVGDIDEALAFYGRLFDFELRGRSKTSAFIDLGDQFLALQKGRTQPADDGRHFGLVVDDKDAVRHALAKAGVNTLPGQFLDFLDPWGNRVEIVSYENIQFTKAPNVLRGMGLSHLPKNKNAIEELTSGHSEGGRSGVAASAVPEPAVNNSYSVGAAGGVFSVGTAGLAVASLAVLSSSLGEVCPAPDDGGVSKLPRMIGNPSLALPMITTFELLDCES